MAYYPDNEGFDPDERCGDCDLRLYQCPCSECRDMPAVLPQDHPILFDSTRPEVFDPVRDMIDDLAPTPAPVQALVREEFEVKGHRLFVWHLPPGFYGVPHIDLTKLVTKIATFVPQPGKLPVNWHCLLVDAGGTTYRPIGLQRFASKTAGMAWLVVR